MDRSQIMAAIRSKNTRPEMLVRRLVHALGYRYRLHSRKLPGKPDLVFRSKKKVIFVHGCFWHLHGCQFSHLPKTNTEYWTPKLERNRIRDAEHLKMLHADGWEWLVIWECELKKNDDLENTIRKFLG